MTWARRQRYSAGNWRVVFHWSAHVRLQILGIQSLGLPVRQCWQPFHKRAASFAVGKLRLPLTTVGLYEACVCWLSQKSCSELPQGLLDHGPQSRQFVTFASMSTIMKINPKGFWWLSRGCSEDFQPWPRVPIRYTSKRFWQLNHKVDLPFQSWLCPSSTGHLSSLACPLFSMALVVSFPLAGKFWLAFLWLCLLSRKVVKWKPMQSLMLLWTKSGWEVVHHYPEKSQYHTHGPWTCPQQDLWCRVCEPSSST